MPKMLKFEAIASIIPEPFREGFQPWYEAAADYALTRLEEDGDFTPAFHDDIEELVATLTKLDFPDRPASALVIYRMVYALNKALVPSGNNGLNALLEAAEYVLLSARGYELPDALARLEFMGSGDLEDFEAFGPMAKKAAGALRESLSLPPKEVRS